MPVVAVTMIKGYDADIKRRLSERLTDVVAATINASPEAITIVVNEVEPSGYMRGRAPQTAVAAPRSPSDLCLDFLRRMEARDLDGAAAFLAPSFEMIFPGPVRMARLQELVDWAQTRYRAVRKAIDRVDETPGPGGVTVIVTGTLAGEWLDGARFEGVRFIDRFLVTGGAIARQEVWNDLAERRNAR